MPVTTIASNVAQTIQNGSPGAVMPIQTGSGFNTSFAGSNMFSQVQASGNVTIHIGSGDVDPEKAKEIVQRLTALETDAARRAELAVVYRTIKGLQDDRAELKKKTASIKTLPDGRTKFGGMIDGSPDYYFIQDAVTVSNYTAGNILQAFQSADKVVKVMEASLEEEKGVINSYVALTASGKFLYYYRAALIAFQLADKEPEKYMDIAFKYALSANKFTNTVEGATLLCVAAWKVGKPREAYEGYKKLVDLKAEPKVVQIAGVNTLLPWFCDLANKAYASSNWQDGVSLGEKILDICQETYKTESNTNWDDMIGRSYLNLSECFQHMWSNRTVTTYVDKAYQHALDSLKHEGSFKQEAVSNYVAIALDLGKTNEAYNCATNYLSTHPKDVYIQKQKASLEVAVPKQKK